MTAKTKDTTATFEKLGAFYLGRGYDLESGSTTADPLLYDAKDLTTHAVCVGMTGSGKTGLCISLLEEAAIDGIPTIAIDPKGDLGNLMLTFPKLRPEDFRPWIEEAQAARKGMSSDEFAASTAELWKNGLAEWGQDGARISKLRNAADVAIYTPGSSAGLPLTVMRSFTAPGADFVADADAFRERIMATVSGLLALLGIDADPVRSREHILLSNLFERAWSEGRDLDLATLIAEVQSPPIERIGVMELETFYPSKERSELSMTLNNLLASPAFAAWMEGEPLEIPRLLWKDDGTPRISVLSVAHLSEAERMFFVTLLLNEVIAWMRTQAGTASLRALLYMDEVFGYFPPTANPPSKNAMLTLLKQARAYGVGVVLATQNPVDLDYKGLSNTGTWFLGRLQTERDKMRIMDGLEGASSTAGASFDRKQVERTISGLKSRVFLMHNVHDEAPAVFHTRWAMSYLRGPLTRTQIQTLMADRKAAASDAAAAAAKPAPVAAKAKPGQASTHRPVLPADVTESFLPPADHGKSGARLVYRPALLGTADLHFANARAGIDRWETVGYVTPLGATVTAKLWDNAEPLPEGEPELVDEPEADAEFARLPSAAAQAKSFTSWQKSFKTHLYQNRTVTILKCAELKLTSSPEETEAEFKVRLREAAREKRDTAVEQLRKRYSPKLKLLQDRIRRAEEKLGREKSQYDQQKMQTAISMGATVLGALFGRKVASVGTVGRATTTARGVGRAAREKQDMAAAARDIEAFHQQYQDLDAEFQEEIATLDVAVDPDTFELKEQVIRPRKTDITVGRFGLVWLPWWIDEAGIAEPAYE
ncbi:MAG: ATP-binding protein [Gemmatimonadota bacterium]|nr:ATP-binding protein [Gemmatimonadota bacterium]